MTQQLQKVDIASLKSGQPVYFSFDNGTDRCGIKWDKHYGLFDGFHGKYPKYYIREAGEARFISDGAVYYPPLPDATTPPLRPIDFKTIREGLPVVIRQKGSEWDKREGVIFGWSNIRNLVQVAISGGPVKYFPASIVFHAPESKTVSLAEKPFEVGEEVVTNKFSPEVFDWSHKMYEVVGKSGKIDNVDHFAQGIGYNIHGHWWPASALERVEDKAAVEQPVLIELERAVEFIKEYGDICGELPFIHHFQKGENQYHLPQPKEHQASRVDEWVPEVGDIVRLNGFVLESQKNKSNYEGAASITDINYFSEHRPTYKVFGVYWDDVALTLVKKRKAPESEADPNYWEGIKPEIEAALAQPSFTERMEEHWQTQGKPFSLADARQLYQQGGISKDVALRFWSEGELMKRELPMSLFDIGDLSGYIIANGKIEAGIFPDAENKGYIDVYPTRSDAEAALATAQLLQLRQAWLEQESPGWVPDWDNEKYDKWCVERNGNDLEIDSNCYLYQIFSFPTENLATRFLFAFRLLLNTAFCLPAGNEEGGVV